MKYKVLICPHPMIHTPQQVRILKAYVENGGTLILGARAGMKDSTGQCLMAPMPGYFRELTGTEVREFTFVGPADDAVYMDWDGKKVETGIFNDILQTVLPEQALNGQGTAENGDGELAYLSEAEDATEVKGSSAPRVLARYCGNYYKGEPALMETRLGKGRILHFGGTFTRQNVQVFLQETGLTHFLDDWCREIPEECEAALREKDGREYLVLLNYASEPKTVVLSGAAVDLDDGGKVEGEFVLPAYGTKVLRRNG